MNNDQIPNFLAWKTIHVLPEIFVQRYDDEYLIFDKFVNIK